MFDEYSDMDEFSISYVEGLENKLEKSKNILIKVKKALLSLPTESLGMVNVKGRYEYPIKDELIHNINKILEEIENE